MSGRLSLNLAKRISIINRVCHQMTESQKTETSNAKKAPPPALNFLLMGAGSMFTSMLIAGFLVGYVLDQLFDTTPIFLMFCGLLGFIGGLQKVHRLSSKLDNFHFAEKNDSDKS